MAVYSIELTQDEFGNDRWFVCDDATGEWIGEAHSTREQAAEAITDLKREAP